MKFWRQFNGGCVQSWAVIPEEAQSRARAALVNSEHTPATSAHARSPTHLSSFARNSNQHREHWEPIRCSFLHIGLFDFAVSKQTICPAIAMNIAKKQKSWFGVSSSQEARDVMATIMCSLILTAANGSKTSKWLWAGREGGGSDGKHHRTLLVYLNRLESVLN